MVRRSGWLKGQVARLLPPGETILQLRSRTTASGRVVVAGTDRAFYVMQGAGRPKTAVRLPHEHVSKVRVNDDLFVISLRNGQDYVIDVGSPLPPSLSPKAAVLYSRSRLLPALSGAVSLVARTASSVRDRWWASVGGHSPAVAAGEGRRRRSGAAPSDPGFELEAVTVGPSGQEPWDVPQRRRRSRSDAPRQP